MSLFEPGQNFGRISHVDREFSWVEDEDFPILEEPVSRASIVPFIAVLLLCVGALGYRMVSLQITHAASNQLLAEGNRIRNRELSPSRGTIIDRYGEVLATNIPEFVLELTPADLPRTKDGRAAAYERITEITGIAADELKQKAEANGLLSLEPIILQSNLSHENSLLYKVKFKDLPSVRVVDHTKRKYVEGAGFSHLLGYTGKVNKEELQASKNYSSASIVGRAGVEQQYESILYGVPGVEQYEVDSRGYLQRIIGEQLPQSGTTLSLTIDAALQRKLGEVLQAKLDELESPGGVGIIERPKTGEILALVSLPDYPANEFTSPMTSDRYKELLNDKRSLFTNRAIAGVYPSGSVVKPVIAAAGLEDGVITESTTINAPGEIRVGDFVFPDWKTHGITDVKKAIAVSSNVFFYAVGGGWENIRGLGVNRLVYYLDLFGFGRRTGIDLPGEVQGLVPNPQWKQETKHEQWYLGDTYHLSIGQGDFLVTPLQLEQAINAIANRGQTTEPHITKQDNVTSTQIKDMSAASLNVVRAGMRQGVENGSSRLLQSLPVTSAGKTGTAQFGSEGKTHAWWTGFAPYDDPEVSMTVLIEAGGEGSAAAEPVAQEVLNWYFSRSVEDRS